MQKIVIKPMKIVDHKSGEVIIVKKGFNRKKLRRLKNNILIITTVLLSITAFVLSLIAVGEDTPFLMGLKYLAGVYAIMFLWVFPFCKANNIFV